MSDGLDVLAFGPHPDDVELFCGGLLAKLVDLGYRVGVVDLTRGEMSSRGTPETRAAETVAATQVLGLHLRENLGLADTQLDPWSHAQVAPLVEAIRRHRPELVIAPWHVERHPDHEAASQLVTRAVFFAGVRKFAEGLAIHTPRQVLHYPMRHLTEPSFLVDITAQAARKDAAIRCYVSQVQPDPSQPPTLVGSALSLPSIEARDRFYGAQIGVARAEPYVVRAALAIADPIAHFRANTSAAPLFFPER
jgi:bacillithiol biosynthesis deacetylase BshB1